MLGLELILVSKSGLRWQYSISRHSGDYYLPADVYVKIPLFTTKFDTTKIVLIMTGYVNKSIRISLAPYVQTACYE